jgi:hypothetical protein
VAWTGRLETIWHDPVWSKVIATVISAAILGLVMWIVSYSPWPLLAWVWKELTSIVEIVSALITAHHELVQWLIMAAIMTALFVWVQRLRRQLMDLAKQAFVVLDKSASANLTNWDYIGGWSANGQALDVTNSGDGGLLRWGTDWKNYDFHFDFKIVNTRAAWIVRAQADRSYVMIQCDGSLIRPHTRTSDPDRGFKVLEERPHGLSLREWNKVKTEVRGHALRVFINDQLVYEHPSLLQDSTSGTVGFRCSGYERASFREIEVIQKANCSS